MTAIEGGNFLTGALTGAVGSVAGSLSAAAKLNTASGLLFGSMVSGMTAELTGGNFWQGAGIGFTVGLLNHELHRGIQSLKERGWIRQQLKEAGYSNSRIRESLMGLDKAGRENMILEIMGRVKNLRLLEGLYDKGLLTFEATMGDDPYGDGATARTSGNIHTSNGTSANIEFYDRAFKSLYSLARTIHHEGIHVQHYNSGLMNAWYGSARSHTHSINTSMKYSYQVSDYWANLSTYYATGSIYYYDRANNFYLRNANQICSTCLR
ncbi:hypothetical protein GO491_01175 [Flavobacteriaceae bacterium Ap0902]|nr:hypothetical protein [Flavobacteriaceae bacterium Ap0902]